MYLALVHPRHGKKWHIDHAWALCYGAVYGMSEVYKVRVVEIDEEKSISEGMLYTYANVSVEDVCKVCCKTLLRKLPGRTSEEKIQDRRSLSIGRRLSAFDDLKSDQ